MNDKILMIGQLARRTRTKVETIRFYEKNGFSPSHRLKNFFTDNHDHPMVEDVVLLVDMVYLKKEL